MATTTASKTKTKVFPLADRVVIKPLEDCPACREPKLERLISATSFQLKGGGWYKDLYSSSKNSKSDKAA